MTYAIFDSETRTCTGNYKNAKTARHIAEKKNAEYGAYRYFVRSTNI